MDICPPPPIYKPTQNPLQTCVSPGLISGILRYRTSIKFQNFLKCMYVFHNIELFQLLKIPEDPREQRPLLRLTAGAMAGIISSTVTYPLDLIRWVLQSVQITLH